MAVLTKLLQKFFGGTQEDRLKPFLARVETINALEPSISALSDNDLSNKTQEFKKRLSGGESLDELLPEAFAVVREAAKRTLNMRHFDVQLVGGMVLHSGKIAEMKTGEGKTLVSTLAAYLNALEGKGVYLVTVNDYLAKRDSEWMGEVYEFLGLTVGLIQSGMDLDLKIKAYQCDITYGTNNEFGFDFLRDNLALDLADCSQTRRHYAIIDEVDSILIDEARTPLIISGPIKDSTAKYKKVIKVVRQLQKETHFTLDEKHKNVVLTDDGVTFIEKQMNLKGLYSVSHMDVAHMAVQCLRAVHLYKCDVDYVVKDGDVVIVDEFTGRLMEGRRYSDGLHQAIEASENLIIREESQTLASVTFQNYFRLFPKLAGMTGTAQTEEAEFVNIYDLEVSAIPTNKPMVRDDQSDVVYKSKIEKYNAIVNDIKEAHKTGQPVLVGTITIETSEMLSDLLHKQGIPHKVLNAKYHEKEAEIISDAGQKGKVTIATNMAGRGTDIVLGEGVKDLGGLYVIGSERHESRRIDNQLRGRSGRQGDPGRSRFYVSLQDDLMRLFGSDRISGIMDKLGLPEDTPIEHSWISKSIERAQSKVEKYHFGIRKQVLQYDDVMNKQRESVYALRAQFMKRDNLDKKMQQMISELVMQLVEEFIIEDKQLKDDEEAKEGLALRLQAVFPIQNLSEIFKNVTNKAELNQRLSDAFFKLYTYRKEEANADIFEELITKRVFLLTLDRMWVDHMNNMEALREGIGLRAWGNRDPLVEYKMEAFDMYNDLLVRVSEEALSVINRSGIKENPNEQAPALPKPDTDDLSYSSSKQESSNQTTRTGDKVGRNDPCPCGSGKKYKKCCMNSDNS